MRLPRSRANVLVLIEQRSIQQHSLPPFFAENAKKDGATAAVFEGGSNNGWNDGSNAGEGFLMTGAAAEIPALPRVLGVTFNCIDSGGK